MLEAGRRVFEIEIEALKHVQARLGETFISAAQAIFDCHGKVIVTGLGKSGAVGRKIAATFSSTGTPAVFLHAADSVHGDIGIIGKNDIVVAISYSGEQPELSLIVPVIKRLGVRFIAITGRPDSELARSADIVLLATVPQEACPLGLAPTSSTTAILALGDALAVAVYEARGFTTTDFAFRHPGGALGRSLATVKDLMHSGEALPVCNARDPMSQVIMEMTRKKLGMTCIVDDAGTLKGVFTDGDLRRLIQKDEGNFLPVEASKLMASAPKTTSPDLLAVQALTIMEERRITSLVVVDPGNKPIGVLHIHDILRSKVI